MIQFGRPVFVPIALAIVLASISPSRAQQTGPGTSVPPFLLPMRDGVTTVSIATVDDPLAPSPGGQVLVGVLDGCGAFRDDGQPTDEFTFLVSHELQSTAGVPRAHGSPGAFVTRFALQNDLTILSASDSISSPTSVFSWSAAGYVPGTVAFHRFCSADLPDASAFRFENLGADARIYLAGEENSPEGRGWAHVVSGPSAGTIWQLPRVGRHSHENLVACPFSQARTLVVSTDDRNPGQVYVYEGFKQAGGSDIERAGLTNGQLYGVRVPGHFRETRGSNLSGPFELAALGNVEAMSGAQLESASDAAGVTGFLRPEDGAWDPRPNHPNDFYFVTTDTTTVNNGRSRLYRLRFLNVTMPSAGGTIELLLDGTEGHQMLDNIAIDSLGRILMQEDPGSDFRLARVWLYDINRATLLPIAQHAPQFFQPGSPTLLTTNEESSGIIDAAEFLGPGWFLLTSMAHYVIPDEPVEGGQLLAMYVDTAIRGSRPRPTPMGPGFPIAPRP